MCYTYDSLSRVTKRTVKNLSNTVLSEEAFSYDAAGNITDAPDSCFAYDANNRLVVFDGNSVSYDLDGNLLSNGFLTCSYDSANKLISAGGHTYTYNAEDVRIRNLCAEEDTTYTYNTNAKLSMLLMKTTGGVVTKYVYGRGLIGEEVSNAFKTYHFDCRGSTIAITDATGNITDTFAYDTYGKLISRTGTGKVIFGYNGRDSVVTDDNGLIYMRARYYSPEMKRFINADVVAGAISNAITLNRFAYANGNPVSFVDPFGLWGIKDAWNGFRGFVSNKVNNAKDWAVGAANDVKDWAVDAANDVKDWAVDTATEVKDWIVDSANEVKDWAVGTYNDAKDTVVETYNEVKDWTVDTANDIKNWAVGTKNNVKKAIMGAVGWVGTNVIEPTGKALSNAGRQIKDGFTNVANTIADNVGAKVTVGKEKAVRNSYYFFASVEEGIGYSKDFANEKPVTFFASAGDNWWEFWKWSIGIDVNIDGYGGGISLGTESSINVHAGDVSHEVGVNALGRISHKIAHKVEDSFVYTKYSLNGPETALVAIGVPVLIYFAPSLIPVIGAGVPALAGALG